MNRSHAPLLALLLLLLPFAALTQEQQPPQPEEGEKPPIEEGERPPEQGERPPVEGEQPFEPVEPKPAEGEKKPAEEAEKKEEKWDVNNPPGPREEVTIDVAEGTWMSVDVSPDGKEVVFDLLGDLYVVPIGGGEARALTADIAWQEQPRYSPDGKRIAFTSDQGGGDNVWIADRDGKNPQQVSKETFRLLNSPDWSPDGEYIVARKHFTSQRSAGAGEMWLYHRSGGEGLQLTKRRTQQKDSGEPVFSPDGRYLYYSDDATPGEIFEYNKDPNSQIYVIQRLDRKTGKTEELVTGSGGAVRPTPSPDGKLLAFIRRVRGKSVLHLHDLASGEEWPLHDGMERDMQETWAIHGVYPGMSWTPDSRSIVFWAGGKIRRIDVASRKVSDIPFHVRATKQTTPALRFPQEVAPARFATKMLRWVEVSPKGDRAVFQTLGKLWVRDLPNGKPRRLTRQDEHFEHFPAFSRDGRSIVYTTWDDEELGRVRVVSAAGGDGRTIVDAPGHYADPAFSPDGKQVVYAKIGGGFLRTPAWSRETGIYRVPAGGGEPERITEDGVRPHFGAESDRVYLLRLGPENKRLLASVGLDGKDERTHLQSEHASEYRVSPDGRWVAWTERFQVYAAPFVPTGQTVDIGPKAAALPLKQVTRDGGSYLHWSGDSQKLHWSLGPELFTRSLRDTFAFLEGAPKELPEPPTEGVDLGFEVPADVPSGTVAFTGARLVTMRGDEVIEDGTVVVERNRIVAVGPRAQVEVPRGAHVVDAAGKTIIPGLVDVHWHGAFATDDIVPEENWGNLASLTFGVTTIHDPSNDTGSTFAAAEMARAGLVTAPRIFSTGTILYGATTAFTAVIDKLEEARGHLRRMKAAGAFSVKSYNQPRRDQRQQVIAAARELEMMVVPEGGSLFQHNMNMVVDGHTGIEHSIPVPAVYADVKQLWPPTGVGYTPTLVVGYGGLWGEEYWYATTNVWEDPRLTKFVPREFLDERSRRRRTAPAEEWGHFNNARVAAELSKLGVKVNVGAHGQREGLAAHWEIWMLAQGGLTPMEALRSATLTGAWYLGMDKDIGSLEPGKLADLAVLDANPLEDIKNSRTVSQVMVNGRLYDAETMNQIGNHPKKRGQFFWERQAPAFGEAKK
ncbi:MAG TPA: amidohydrolase family protein [Thermoanaerobaculia bacterium]|nr:amidohydrolase family protein [Thermoanaerobaculia bacterium]